MAIAPVVPNVIAQLVILNALMVGVLAIICPTMPWRVEIASYLDGVVPSNVIMIVLLDAIYTSGNTGIESNLCLVLFLLTSAELGLCCCLLAIFRVVRRRFSQQYADPSGPAG
jgi:hypothetical protein